MAASRSRRFAPPWSAHGVRSGLLFAAWRPVGIRRGVRGELVEPLRARAPKLKRRGEGFDVLRQIYGICNPCYGAYSRDPMRSFLGDGVAKCSTRVVEAGRAALYSFAIDGAGTENGQRL